MTHITQLTSHTAKFDRRIMTLILAGVASIFVPSSSAQTTWTPNGNDINNTNTGNVAIGTTAPTHKLQVAGSGASAGDSVLVTDSNNVTTAVDIANTSSGGRRWRLQSVGGSITGRVGNFEFVDIPTNWKALVIQPTGNIGIGTVSPGFRLDVQGGSLNASGGLCIAGDCKTSWSQVVSQWATSGSNINYNSGNVGIGTTAPGTPLTVLADANALTFRAWRNANTVGYGLAGLRIALNNSSGAVKDYASLNGLITTNTAGSEDGAMTFWTAKAGSLIEQARLDKDGNLGVGTSSPGGALEVYRNQNAVVRLIALNNPSTGSSAQAASSFLEGGTEKAKVAVNGSGSTGYFGGPNAMQIWNLSNAPIVFGTNSAERARIDSSGNLGIGTNTPAAKLDVNGNTNVTGNLNVTGNIAAKYQDLAEWVESSQALSAGTVVVLDQTKSNQVVASSQSYDTRVAGVISLQPGIALGENGAGKVLVATTGRVRIKVDASRGSIQVGDLLVTSDVAGLAMKSQPINIGGVQIHRPGTLIGKALEPLDKGTSEILVLLSLQ